MRRLLILIMVMISMLLSCSTISNINEVGKSKVLTSQFIGTSGGTLEYRKPDSHSDGVSIIVAKGTVLEEINFSICYFESFPKKPKDMKPESIAFEIKFDAMLNRRIKIVIPFISDIAVQKGLALFRLYKNDRKWHFAGGCSLNINTKTVSALIDAPGIFAVMRLEDDLPSEALTDFEVGFDTFNAPSDFTKRYCNASTSFALWFYNKIKFSSLNLYNRYSNKESLLVARAACAEFDKTQFTSTTELFNNAELAGADAAMYIKTALAFENRPIIAVLDETHTIIINKYQGNDFSFYDPFEGNIEQKLSYEPISGKLIYNGKNIDNLAFFGMLDTCNDGFKSIYDYFENKTSIVIDEVVEQRNNDTLQASSGNLTSFEFDITDDAVTNDI
ncbi:MAG: hypothetical protein KAR20_03305, partial [Candidatus Heimdallarchaeota archaeon]|nr:hypothetical protein [Candidatus Heimdallarchaeota archaeon]